MNQGKDPFDFTYLLKKPPLTIGFIYLFVSIIGFLYVLISKSKLEVNLFNYYELTDFLLIGIKNYKVLLVSISVILLFNIFFTAFFTYLLRKFRPPLYGQAFDEDSQRWSLIEAVKSALKSLLFRTPIIILLIISITKYGSNSSSMIVYMGLGILVYMITIAVLALTKKEIYLDETGVKILIYFVILIGLMTGITLGYEDRNNPQPNIAEVSFENETILGDVIGTTNKYIFIQDSSFYVINKDLVKSIKYFDTGNMDIDGHNVRSDTIPNPVLIE